MPREAQDRWETLCHGWQGEHELAAEQLTEAYAEYFKDVAIRMLEPVTRNESGSWISAHDIQGHNPRRAGRKPLGIITTTTKVTVPNHLYPLWEQVPNKAEFTRDAVAAALQAGDAE